MNVRTGQHVHTADGVDMGGIKYLVMDPETERVQSVVVEQGRVLPRDVEVPVEELHGEGDGPLFIRLDEAQVEALPQFNKDAYTTPPSNPAADTPLPMVGVLWPTSYSVGGYTAGFPARAWPAVLTTDDSPDDNSERREIREELGQANAVLKEGDDVISDDGEKVGVVGSIVFDAPTGRAVKFIVRKGWLIKEDVELPAEAVSGVDDGVVYLRLDRAHFAERKAA
jgi:sporulation protein YlmC with PRC-barrel domain